MKIQKYTGVSYFFASKGLDIYGEDGNKYYTVFGDSTNEIEERAKELINKLNTPYYQREALLADARQNFELGLITRNELENKEWEIMSKEAKELI